ncbi:MAG TPA: YbhB/YbcL family Raf kinase inhibitor-like protein [Candidatus Saccharimonadales bacterium]|nr:YbhB/YbcL family Raf kinase inhibitor-like protein [Candidatus Saccharimonadales bacterium]
MFYKKNSTSIVLLILVMCLFHVRSQAVNSLTVTSQSFKNNDFIPAKHSLTQGNISPHLTWTAGPSGTKSYAIICTDPDAPTKPWVHLVVFNIPATVQSLPEGALNKTSKLVTLGINDYKQTTYGGPNPPPGTPHHYHFDVYALDIDVLNLPKKTTKADVLQAMQGHILAQDRLTGLYKA